MKNLTKLLLILFFSSCTKKWDPNLQFKLQTEKIKSDQENYQLKLETDTKNRMNSLESDILITVKNGLSNRQFDSLVGFKYTILAQNINSGQRWERRIYKWEDIVKSKWSENSMEFKFCEKNRNFFIVTVNESNVVNVEYL
tara:strand:+ start:259 stop:681 length:423 start_codon:yes stop_codon:yes gene_type:complete